MSSALDTTSSTDVTLHHNIASPPKNARPSFTQLHEAPTMASLGVDEKVSEDVTLTGGFTHSRRPSENGYQGLDAQEVKKATMASWLGNIAQGDGTLPE